MMKHKSRLGNSSGNKIPQPILAPMGTLGPIQIDSHTPEFTRYVKEKDVINRSSIHHAKTFT